MENVVLALTHVQNCSPWSQVRVQKSGTEEYLKKRKIQPNQIMQIKESIVCTYHKCIYMLMPDDRRRDGLTTSSPIVASPCCFFRTTLLLQRVVPVARRCWRCPATRKCIPRQPYLSPPSRPAATQRQLRKFAPAIAGQLGWRVSEFPSSLREAPRVPLPAITRPSKV